MERKSVISRVENPPIRESVIKICNKYKKNAPAPIPASTSTLTDHGLLDQGAAAYPMEINVYSVQDQGTPAQPQGSVELIRFTRYRYAPKDSYRYWYMAELILQI